MSRWRAASLIGVHVLAAFHILHWRLTGATVSPVEPSEAMEFAKHDVVNAGLIFFAAAILLTAIFGRFFCGWGCHLVALQDLCRALLLRLGIRPRPFRSRLLRWVPVGAFVYMFLWPVAYRLWIGDRFGPVELQLSKSAFWETFPGWPLALITFAVCGFVLVYFLGAKGFCTYACPYGGIFGPVDKLAPLAIRVTDACEGCAHCTATCSSNVRVHEEVRDYGRVVDTGCMKCMDCVSVCPKDALYLGFGAPSIATRNREAKPTRQRFDLTWGEELLLAATFLAALVVFRGLYNVFPFLFSLGWASLVAFLSLQTYRLATRASLRIGHLQLRSENRVRPAGWALVALVTLIALFWAHSAAVRGRAYLGDRLYSTSVPLVAATIQRGSPPTLDLAQRDHVEATIAHLDFVDRWALRGSAEVDIRLAWLHRLAARPVGFRAHAEEALAAAPSNHVMRHELADYHLRQGDGERARELYERVLELSPEATAAAINLGTLYATRGDLHSATRVFETGIAARPETPRLHYNLGLAWIALGVADSAIVSLEQALQLEPDFLEARENLAGYLASLGRFEEGLVHYRKAIEQAPDDASTRMLTARAYLGAGDRASAARELQQALRIEPTFPGARELLNELR